MGNRSLLCLGLVLAACLSGAIACRPAAPSPGASINLYALADLGQTIRIDVLRHEVSQNNTPATYEVFFSIDDRQAVCSLAGALDAELKLNRRAHCPALYTLVFYLADGRQFEFDYACQMTSPAFIRGGQRFWQGQEVIGPDAFNRLLDEYINEAIERRRPFVKPATVAVLPFSCFSVAWHAPSEVIWP